MSDSKVPGRRKGVCKNPDCDLCMSREVQEIEPGEDFVCSECGCSLSEINGNIKDIKKKSLSTAMIAVIASVAIIIAGVIYWFGFRGGEKVADSEPGNGGEVVVDSPKVDTERVDTPVVGVTTPEDDNAKGKDDNKEPVKQTAPQSGSGKLTLGCGTYDGPVKNGKPDGMGGTFTFNSSYTLDLKDAQGSTVKLGRGDKIISTKFDNGKFVQGEIIFANNDRKYVTGVSATL